MNTPNPLIPQGSLERQAKGKSTVRIAILTIISIHAVFFAGLLMQGCRRDEGKPGALKSGETTNQTAGLPPEGTTFYPANTQEVGQVSSTLPPATGAAATITEPPSTPPPPVITEPPADGKAYKVAKGDTLAKIAKANGVTLSAITKANRNLEASKLKVGQTIQIPTGPAASAEIGFAEPGKGAGAANAGGGPIHQVKAGETLTKIAKQHSTSVKAIRAANNLKTDRLYVGQKLKLPGGQTSSAAADSDKSSAVSKMTATNPAYVTPFPASPEAAH